MYSKTKKSNLWSLFVNILNYNNITYDSFAVIMRVYIKNNFHLHKEPRVRKTMR